MPSPHRKYINNIRNKYKSRSKLAARQTPKMKNLPGSPITIKNINNRFMFIGEIDKNHPSYFMIYVPNNFVLDELKVRQYSSSTISSNIIIKSGKTFIESTQNIIDKKINSNTIHDSLLSHSLATGHYVVTIKPNTTTNEKVKYRITGNLVTPTRSNNSTIKKLIQSVPKSVITNSNRDDIISWLENKIGKLPYSYGGYYPLYVSVVEALAASPTKDYTSRTINGIVFYMPMGTETFLGDYKYNGNSIDIPLSNKPCVSNSTNTTKDYDSCVCFSLKNYATCLQKCHKKQNQIDKCVKGCGCINARQQFMCDPLIYNDKTVDLLCAGLGKDCCESMDSMKPYCKDVSEFIDSLGNCESNNY